MTTLQGRLLRLLVTFPLYLAVMILMHEAGHAIAAAYATPAVVEVHVWPGYEVYPDFGTRTLEPWPQASPAVTMLAPPSPPVRLDANGYRIYHFNENELTLMQRHLPLIALMGSTATTLTALLSLILISLLKPQGLTLWLLSAGSLLHLDMLTYAVLPTFLGTRHLYWIGGKTPEPVDGLVGLGVSASFAIAAIVLLSLLQFAWLVYLLRLELRRPAGATTG